MFKVTQCMVLVTLVLTIVSGEPVDDLTADISSSLCSIDEALLCPFNNKNELTKVDEDEFTQTYIVQSSDTDIGSEKLLKRWSRNSFIAADGRYKCQLKESDKPRTLTVACRKYRASSASSSAIISSLVLLVCVLGARVLV